MGREMNFVFKRILNRRLRKVYRILKNNSPYSKREIFENLPGLFSALSEEDNQGLELFSFEAKKAKKYEEIKLKLKKIKNYLHFSKE